MDRLIPVLATAFALLPTAAPGAAQTCGLQSGISAAAGYVSHRVADGTPGTAVGADVGVIGGPVAVRVGYRRMMLRGDAADPDVLRVHTRYPALEVDGVTLCADALAGVSRFVLDTDAGAVIAGGVGLTAAGTVGPLRPYLSVRGLGAWATGTVLGVGLSATGLAVGVAGGVTAELGRLLVRMAGSRDGFDNGLGATPYPYTSVELSIGYRF